MSYFRLLISSNLRNFGEKQLQLNNITEQFRKLSIASIRSASEKVPDADSTFNVDQSPETAKPVPDGAVSIDRTKVIPVETSIRYLTSAAYRTTYGDQPVWVPYRRNHKGGFAPKKTRKTCIRKGVLSTGNPCPICRDEYLVLHHQNLELLKQFISPHSGQVLSYSITGVCQRKHRELEIAVERAMDFGLITFDVPFREFDYSQYYNEDLLKKLEIS